MSKEETTNEISEGIVETGTTLDLADLDWDNVEHYNAGDTKNVKGNSEESEDSDSDASGKQSTEEDTEITREASDFKKEDSSGKGKSDSKDKSEVKKLEEFGDDDLIEVKVDGELQKISIKEFKNGISGAKAIAKRFSEYDKKEKQFKKEIEEVNTYVNTFAEKMSKKDPISALEYLAQFTAIPPYEVKEMLVQALAPEFARRQTLTETDLEFEKEKSKLEFEKKQIETQKSKIEQEKSQSALQKQIQDVRDSFGIDEETWESAYAHLDKTLPPDENITISTVKEYVLFTRAESAIKLVNEDLLNDNNVLSDLVKIQSENPDFTQEDLQYVIEKAFGTAKVDAAKSKVQEVAQKKQTPAKTVLPTKQQLVQETYDSWEDIQ